MQVNPGEITVMENVEDVQVSIGHRTIADLVRETLSDDTGTKAYLRQWWLTTAIESLIAARHRAGLSQDKLAQLLGTQQSVVARMEKDDDGRMSLHRFIDYALACGEIPFDVQLIDVQRMSAYAKMAPDAARTVTTFSNHVYAHPSSQRRTRGYQPRGSYLRRANVRRSHWDKGRQCSRWVIPGSTKDRATMILLVCWESDSANQCQTP